MEAEGDWNFGLDIFSVKEGDELSFSINPEQWDDIIHKDIEDELTEVTLTRSGITVKAQFIKLLDKPQVLVRVSSVTSIN